MQIRISNVSNKFLKKSHSNLKVTCYKEIKKIALNPDLGVKKIGDLLGISVHTFKFENQSFLISYRSSDDFNLTIEFIGTHENFYRDLKKYLKN